MAAHDNATVTIDTDEMVYTDKGGLKHTVTNAQTFGLLLSAATTGEDYKINPANTSLSCTDGTTLEVMAYAPFSNFNVAADATQKLNAGSIWFREGDGSEVEWNIRSITIDDVDEPTVITEAVFERADQPVVTMTYTTVTVAQ